MLVFKMMFVARDIVHLRPCMLDFWMGTANWQQTMEDNEHRLPEVLSIEVFVRTPEKATWGQAGLCEACLEGRDAQGLTLTRTRVPCRCAAVGWTTM